MKTSLKEYMLYLLENLTDPFYDGGDQEIDEDKLIELIIKHIDEDLTIDL